MKLYSILKYSTISIIFLMFILMIYNGFADNETVENFYNKFEILWPVALLVYAINELKWKPKDQSNVNRPT